MTHRRGFGKGAGAEPGGPRQLTQLVTDDGHEGTAGGCGVCVECPTPGSESAAPARERLGPAHLLPDRFLSKPLTAAVPGAARLSQQLGGSTPDFSTHRPSPGGRFTSRFVPGAKGLCRPLAMPSPGIPSIAPHPPPGLELLLPPLFSSPFSSFFPFLPLPSLSESSPSPSYSFSSFLWYLF